MIRVLTKPSLKQGLELWTALVVLDDEVLFGTVRWSEQGAMTEALRWAAKSGFVVSE